MSTSPANQQAAGRNPGGATEACDFYAMRCEAARAERLARLLPAIQREEQFADRDNRARARDRKAKKPRKSFLQWRLDEMGRLRNFRYGSHFPDDDAGRDDLEVWLECLWLKWTCEPSPFPGRDIIGGQHAAAIKVLSPRSYHAGRLIGDADRVIAFVSVDSKGGTEHAAALAHKAGLPVELL